MPSAATNSSIARSSRMGNSPERMEDSPSKFALQHIPQAGASTLAIASARTGIFARGRNDAANNTAHPGCNLGLRHSTAAEFSEAAACFERAAQAGPADAQYRLGMMLGDGIGVP